MACFPNVHRCEPRYPYQPLLESSLGIHHTDSGRGDWHACFLVHCACHLSHQRLEVEQTWDEAFWSSNFGLQPVLVLRKAITHYRIHLFHLSVQLKPCKRWTLQNTTFDYFLHGFGSLACACLRVPGPHEARWRHFHEFQQNKWARTSQQVLDFDQEKIID